MKYVIGARIKESRKKRGLTQEALGKLINVSAQVISNWEREYSTPDSIDINALSNVLMVSSDFLLGRTEKPSPELAKQLLNASDKAKQGEGVQEQSADNEKKIGRAFLGGSDQYTEEELDLARAAAKAAVDAYRKAQKKKTDQ